MMMLSALRTSAVRAATRRPMSTTAAPKMHKAKDAWVELKKTRPPPGHDHVSTKLLLLFFFNCRSRLRLPGKKWPIVYLPLCLYLDRGNNGYGRGLLNTWLLSKNECLRDGFLFEVVGACSNYLLQERHDDKSPQPFSRKGISSF